MIPRVPGEPPPDLGRPIGEVRTRIRHELGGLRLDQALQQLMPWRSRSSIQRLIRDGHVALLPPADEDPSRAVDPARAAARVRPLDIVVVRLPPRAQLPEPPAETSADLPVVFEDRWLVAFDKPPGLAVHPSGRRLSGTLINLLHQRYRHPEDPARDIVPRLCHRLDRETSGLILVAKDEWTHSDVRKQFEALTVEKSYLAIVEGEVARDTGWIDARIGPDSHSSIRLKMAVRDQGLEALTYYEVRQRRGGLTLLECFPKTGRQHQIRVHMRAIGHPVVGDKLYGPDERYFLDDIQQTLEDDARTRLRLPRQALHSHRLRLVHPRSGDDLDLVAPLPPDMAALLG